MIYSGLDAPRTARSQADEVLYRRLGPNRPQSEAARPDRESYRDQQDWVPEHATISRLQYVGGPSVAQKISWISKSRATREEDTAYCLLGIFECRYDPLVRRRRAQGIPQTSGRDYQDVQRPISLCLDPAPQNRPLVPKCFGRKSFTIHQLL